MVVAVNKDGAQMKAVHAMQLRVTCEQSTGCNTSVTEPPVTLPVTGRPTTSTGAPRECENNTVEFRPFPGDCRRYTLCACGNSVLLECASGLYLDPFIGKCNFMQLVPRCDAKLN
ncbi:unnamed protein product [Orchesella dallaii]|uniref:Chitin-binding type-2 domain-containing protein n=1 Tax=Orchesella dallaii TaxID=48710 RepID=A0ABP1R0W0_9HEXA